MGVMPETGVLIHGGHDSPLIAPSSAPFHRYPRLIHRLTYQLDRERRGFNGLLEAIAQLCGSQNGQGATLRKDE